MDGQAMNEPVEVENENFRYHHHVSRCKSDDDNPFVQASYRRKSLAQSFYASHTLCDVNTTCQILNRKAQLYHACVDERSEKSVNNYADVALSLASHSGRNDAAKWKSNLRNSRPVTAVVRKLTQCPGQCCDLKVTVEDLKLLSEQSLNNINFEETQNHRDFSDKRAGVSQRDEVASIDQVSNGICKKQQIIQEPSIQDYPNNSSHNKIGFPLDSGTSRWPVAGNSNSSLHAGGSLSRCSSNDFESSESDSFSKKEAVLPCNTFGAFNTSVGRGTGFGAINSRGREERLNSNNVRQRSFCNENYGEPQPSNNYSRGSGSNHNRWDRSSSHSESKHYQDVSSEGAMSSVSASIFRTARDELVIQNQKKYGGRGGNNNGHCQGRGGGGFQKRSLGPRRAGVNGKFVPPIKPTDEDNFGGMYGAKQPEMGIEGEADDIDERLKNIDPKMVETIRNEIMDVGAPVEWDDIAGLEFAKTTIQEIVVWPLLRPDIFTGLRKPPKGLLLFGPPGTGKTLIGKCIASQSQSTFFSISASSLTSKWIGDGEKMVRALFAVAKVHQPSVVFIDEIDSLLTQRSDTEHESSRRIKTEFLVQLDGAGTGDEERILVVGATNRPQELDEAARRRLVKRLYIPLPELLARRQIVERLMSSERSSLTNEQIDKIASLTDGYSGADMKNLCQEASLGPIRSISFSAMHQISADQVRPITIEDFKSALQRVRASVSNKDLDAYVQWDKTYGMGSGL